MIHIEERPRRVVLRAFAIVMGVWLGAAMSLAAGLAGVALWPLIGAGTAAAAAGAGWGRPAAVEPAFRAWNRLVLFFARAAGVWLSGVAFLVVAAAGRAGSRLRLGPRAGETGWKPHEPVPPDGYASRGRHRPGRGEETGWARSLAAWGPRSGNAWVPALVPFLLALRWVRSRGRASLGSEIYTLY